MAAKGVATAANAAAAAVVVVVAAAADLAADAAAGATVAASLFCLGPLPFQANESFDSDHSWGHGLKHETVLHKGAAPYGNWL